MRREINKNKTVVVSGYFNPLHKGHIKMFKEAKKLGDRLIVIVNNDFQVKLKGSVPFMSQTERRFLCASIKWVDQAVISIDEDRTVCRTLENLHPDVFANGGDRASVRDIPESVVCKRNGIEMVFGVGGKKAQSSSTLISKASKKAKKVKHTDGICQACRPKI